RPEVVPALLYLGMHNKDYDAAFGLFERALRADYNGPDAGRALMWMAVTRQRQGRIPEADGFFNDAINRQAPNSVQAGNFMKAYARFLEEQGRQSEAEAMNARAQESWKAARSNAPAGSRIMIDSAYRVGGGTT